MRYRTWFFVADLPVGQRTRDVSSESSSVTWLSGSVTVQLTAWLCASALNTFVPVIARNLLDSIKLLAAASRLLEHYVPPYSAAVVERRVGWPERGRRWR